MSGSQKRGSAVRYRDAIYATEVMYSAVNKPKWVKLFEPTDRIEALARLDLSRSVGGFKIYKLSSKILKS